MGAAAAGRIEDFADVGHDFDVCLAEEFVHEGDLLDADAVLAGDAAAEFDALGEDFVARFNHSLDLLLIPLIE